MSRRKPKLIQDSYCLITLGCPKNVVDSEGMATLLDQAGYRPVEEPGHAEVIVVNTCGFIGPSRAESVATLQELSSHKRSGQFLVAAGCLVEKEGRLKEQIPGLDGLLTTRRWWEISGLVNRLRGKEYGDIPSHGPADGPSPLGIPRRGVGASAYLKIQDGCSAPCAFCTIPSIKGPWHSKPSTEVVQEVQQLTAQGVKEVILVAQDTTAYGYDWGKRDLLAPLLRDIAEGAPDLKWIRVMYAYPGHVTGPMIEVMANIPQIAHYLDIPLQHGHRDTLVRMRRPSNTGMVRRTIEDLRAAMPDIAIRTTFIVGYPGETEAEFQGLLDFMEEMRFDRVGTFTYCREPGTPSYDLPNQVPAEVKEERRARAMELQQRISYEKNKIFVGKVLDVLIDGVGDGISLGRSYRDAPEIDGLVIIEEELPPGSLQQVQIVRALEYDVVGKRLINPEVH
ncbi:MAG: 30S ribosomal protein S12 methylthiotransferase RimO [Chloroflexi bacterium]|nr:30S ribosomal protein S12 methylthiotransferase RimO [Chloroflexota bacterium]